MLNLWPKYWDKYETTNDKYWISTRVKVFLVLQYEKCCNQVSIPLYWADGRPLYVLLNKTFNALNGRRYIKQQIRSNNWQQHKRNLKQPSNALDDTEAQAGESKEHAKPFICTISLKAMLVTLTSAIELVEFLVRPDPECTLDWGGNFDDKEGMQILTSCKTFC